MDRIPAADIGGSNSRFAQFAADGKKGLSLVGTKWLKKDSSTSFGHLIDLLGESWFSLMPEDADIAVIAVAGPVENKTRGYLPFISWGIDLGGAAAYGLQILERTG